VSPGPRTFAARMDAFPQIAAFVAEVCADARVGQDAEFRLTLILEELFTNTVVHGHGGDCEAPVRVALDVQPGQVDVIYEDTCPGFNPFAAATTPPDDSVPLEDRLVGGLGLVLVARLCSRAEYTRLAGGNRIALAVTTAAAS